MKGKPRLRQSSRVTRLAESPVKTELHVHQPVNNGLMIPYDKTSVHFSGKALERIGTGFFKGIYMVLTNLELYIYRDQESSVHKDLHILTPGAFVIKHPAMKISTQEPSQLYPIELLLRGGTSKKSLMIYFDLQDQYQRWLRKLENATNSHKISDYYAQNQGNSKYFVFENSAAMRDGQLVHKNKHNDQKEIDDIEWPDLQGKTVIFEAVHRTSNQPVDVKMISKQGISLNEIEALREEILLLRMCTHQGVVKIFDFFESDDYLYLCLERHMSYLGPGQAPEGSHLSSHALGPALAVGGALGTFFRGLVGKASLMPLNLYVKNNIEHLKVDMYKEIRAMEVIRSIIQTVEYIHEQGIVLNDLDTRGFVVTASSEQGVPRLTWVKNAAIIGPNGQTTGIFGDIHFRAPEVLQGKPYSYKADSWSIGVMLYYILTSRYPFEASESRSLQQSIIEEELNVQELLDQDYSQNVCNLLTKYLQKDVAKRLKVSISLKHNWFKKGGQGKDSILNTLKQQAAASPRDAPASSKAIVEPSPPKG